MKTQLFWFSWIFITSMSTMNCLASEHVRADLNYTLLCYEYATTPAVMVGDYFNSDHFYLSAFIEVRNEPCFNQGALPNHNWRGNASAFLQFPFARKESEIKKICFGFEHESSHPTMGIMKEISNAFEYIYDGQYRNTNLNSMVIRYSKSTYSKHFSTQTVFNYYYYLYSKNTPEMTGTALSTSHGLSFGLEFLWGIANYTVISASIFDRYIFKGQTTSIGSIAVNTNNGVAVKKTVYSVINRMNTISSVISLKQYLKEINRYFELYYKITYGNIYGYVDSRDTRLRNACGIGFSH